MKAKYDAIKKKYKEMATSSEQMKNMLAAHLTFENADAGASARSSQRSQPPFDQLEKFLTDRVLEDQSGTAGSQQREEVVSAHFNNGNSTELSNKQLDGGSQATLGSNHAADAPHQRATALQDVADKRPKDRNSTNRASVDE